MSGRRATMAGRDGKSPVYRITAARTGLSADVEQRTRRYLISMSVRSACFVGAVLVSGPVRWLLVLGAVVLPYVAVVVANGGREPGHDSDLATTVVDLDRPALGPSGRPPLG